jgi:hypothetical protein
MRLSASARRISTGVFGVSVTVVIVCTDAGAPGMQRYLKSAPAHIASTGKVCAAASLAGSFVPEMPEDGQEHGKPGVPGHACAVPEERDGRAEPRRGGLALFHARHTVRAGQRSVPRQCESLRTRSAACPRTRSCPSTSTRSQRRVLEALQRVTILINDRRIARLPEGRLSVKVG